MTRQDGIESLPFTVLAGFVVLLVLIVILVFGLEEK